MVAESKEVDLLTTEERLALAEGVLRRGSATLADIEAAHNWARSLRRMTRLLDAVLDGRIALHIKDGEVVDFYEPANYSDAAEEGPRVDYSS